MYFGVSLLYMASSVALGSYWAFIPVLIIVPLSEETFITLARYGLFTQNTTTFVAFLECWMAAKRKRIFINGWPGNTLDLPQLRQLHPADHVE